MLPFWHFDTSILNNKNDRIWHTIGITEDKVKIMNERYKTIARNVDKLSQKTLDVTSSKQYKSLIKEIDKVIGVEN